MSRDGMVINDFSGGLNNVADPSLIDENELAMAKNVVLSRNGRIISRPPFITANSYPTGATKLRMLGYFRNEDGVVFLIASSQAKTYLYNINTPAWTEIWAYPAEDSTTYLNRLYLINSTNGGGYWSKVSGTYVWTAVAAMPNGNQLHYTKGRLYVSSRALGNTSTIRYSNITTLGDGEVAATSIHEFPVNNFIDVNEGDGQLLIKIIEGNNELFIFRSNSTWRLAYSASAEPTLGTLTTLSNTVGADNADCVAEADNFMAVLYAGTLYQFAGYNYYPLNEYNKVQFTTKPGTWDVKTSVSKIGQYLIVWYHGHMYCYDSEAQAWTEWESDTKAAFFVEAPRGTLLGSEAAVTAYGVPGVQTTGSGLLKFTQEYTTGAKEAITCEVKTKTYDLGQPSKFKRLFGWELLMVAVNFIEAEINAIDTYNVTPMTWNELDDYTWDTAAFNEVVWAKAGVIVPVVVGGLPDANPNPQVVKVSGKQIFKRAYFTIIFRNNGSAEEAPSRLDGIVLYLTNGRRLAMGRTA